MGAAICSRRGDA